MIVIIRKSLFAALASSWRKLARLSSKRQGWKRNSSALSYLRDEEDSNGCRLRREQGHVQGQSRCMA